MTKYAEENYPMLMSNLHWALNENRRPEAIKTLRHLTGCNHQTGSDIYDIIKENEKLSSAATVAITMHNTNPLPDPTMADMDDASLGDMLQRVRDSISKPTENKNAIKADKELYAGGDTVEAKLEKLRKWIKEDDKEEASYPTENEPEYLVVVRDYENRVTACRHFSRESANEGAIEEHKDNPQNTIVIARVIAQTYSRVCIEELE